MAAVLKSSLMLEGSGSSSVDDVTEGARRATVETCAPGRHHRQEVKVQTRGPDAGNPTPKRQGRRSGAPDCRVPGGVRSREGMSDGVIGALPFRTQVKRRKAARSWASRHAAAKP
jgi:hypothetical protein